MKVLDRIDNKWFFSELPFPFKALLFFVKGDLLLLLPLVILILLIGFFSIRFMTLMIGTYIALRYLGEMIYWFAHQFNERKYRPYDFNLKKLDNHAIYIVYQTFAIVGTTAGVGLIFFALLFMK